MSRLGNVGGRLYRGEVSFDFVGRQKLWYSISGLILVLSLVGLFARGLNFSVDFKGGSVIQFPATSTTSLMQVQNAVGDTGDGQGAIVQHVGSGNSATWQVQTRQAGLLPGAAGPVHAVPGAGRPAEPDQRELRGGQLGVADLAEGPAGADRVPHRDRHLPVHRVRVADGAWPR